MTQYSAGLIVVFIAVALGSGAVGSLLTAAILWRGGSWVYRRPKRNPLNGESWVRG